MKTEQINLGTAPGPSPQRRKSSQQRPALQRLITLLADRIAPALFFLLLLVPKVFQLPALLERAGSHASVNPWQAHAELANHGLGFVFGTLVIGLYVVRRPSIRKETGLSQRAIALSGTFLTMAIAISPPMAQSVGLSLISGLLTMIGLAVASAGLMSLRRYFGILPEARGLVTSGLYRHVRHPVYLGEGIASLGVALNALSPLSVFILVAWAVFQWRRALNEETLLAATFPEYRAYASRTRQFVPLVW